MINIKKRISALERRTVKKTNGAWLAFIEEDNTVNLSHQNHDDIFLNSRAQLNEFVKLHDLGRFDLIIVDHATCKGVEPKEL